ncbi:MAG: MoxR family ATPase [Bacteroidota bacterium]
MSDFNYYSDGARRELPVIENNPKINDPSLYRPSKALQDAVNVALALGKPLLVTGEPGTGKTELARHIAWYFNLGDPLEFSAQTTSTVTDLFYKYDALGHFQYAQNQQEPLTLDEVETNYIHYKALGKAIRSPKRRVVLIDEIDKAPRDLPNDVLGAIDQLKFPVSEVRKSYAASEENRPLVIITSNSEKNLPDAFLRRVIYFHIPFPSAEDLIQILHSKIDNLEKVDVKRIVTHFQAIRKVRHLRKGPATAELIYWAILLHKIGFDTKLLENTAALSQQQKDTLLMTYSTLAKTKEDLKALRDMLEK